MVEIAVSDTGSGIAAKEQAIIFERFRQIDASPTRRYGGLGIGLALVREFVTLLGGEVTMESQLGKGSTFRVMLPTRI